MENYCCSHKNKLICNLGPKHQIGRQSLENCQKGRRGKSFVRGTQLFKENLKIPNKTWTGRRMNALRVVQSLNEFQSFAGKVNLVFQLKLSDREFRGTNGR